MKILKRELFQGISSIEGRFKYTEDLPSIKNINQVHKLNFFDNYYGLLNPVLSVNYEREYFKLDKLRITFDKNIKYNFFKSKSKIFKSDQETVMEIKTPIDCSDDYIRRFINIPTSRFSKYSRGVLYLKSISKS